MWFIENTAKLASPIDQIYYFVAEFFSLEFKYAMFQEFHILVKIPW